MRRGTVGTVYAATTMRREVGGNTLTTPNALWKEGAEEPMPVTEVGLPTWEEEEAAYQREHNTGPNGIRLVF